MIFKSIDKISKHYVRYLFYRIKSKIACHKNNSSLVFFNSFPNFLGFPLFFRVQWTTYILHYISIQYGYSMFETQPEFP